MEERCPLLEEKSNPQGIEWLWSAITVRMYLSLLARSMHHGTQEAALGALQNITAGNGAVRRVGDIPIIHKARMSFNKRSSLVQLSQAITFTIVQRENGLQHIKKMLEEGESNVKTAAVALIKNFCRYQGLQPVIGTPRHPPKDRFPLAFEEHVKYVTF